MILLGLSCMIIIMGMGRATAVILVDNGYEDVYIVINGRVKENPQLLSRIKNIFTEGSRQLFELTQNQAYFRKITIIIPKTWALNDNYKKIDNLPSSGEIIKVDNPSHHGNKPYVYRAEGCGAPGLFLHLTPELILADNMPDGDTWGNIIAREWSYLRWGLFSENAMDDGPQFYLNNDTWKPVISDMKGRPLQMKNSMACDLSNMNIYPPTDCIFCPDANQSAGASDKFDHKSVDKALRYNTFVPNEQNIRCDYRSAWEVMRDHMDFKQKLNDQRSRDTETGPVFDFVQLTRDDSNSTYIYRGRSTETNSAYGSFYVGSGDMEFLFMYIWTNHGGLIHAKIRGPSGYTINKNGHKLLSFIIKDIKEKGVYHFFVEVDAITDIQVHVSCNTFKNDHQPVTVDSRLSHTIVDYRVKADLKVFVFVKKGQFPIASADVVAVLKRPDRMAITFNLYDNGQGTDLMKDDGIYTASIFMYYLSGNGMYTVKVIVTSGRNTKVIKSIPGKLSMCYGEGQGVISEAIDKFQRVKLLDTLYITNFEDPFRAEPNEDNDKIKEIRTLMILEDVNAQIAPLTTVKTIEIIDNVPPSKISNFYQVSYEESEGIRRCFRFRWTAVGNDRDIGQAVRYNIRYSTQIFDLLTNFDKCTALNKNRVVPKIAGNTEELLVIGYVDNSNSLKESFIAINAVDRAGNAAKISNIAIIPHTVNLTIVPLGTKCIVETEPPPRITDLKIHNETYIQAKDGMITACFELTWTAVGDEGNHGQAYAYEILYSEEVTNLVLIHLTNSIRNTIIPLEAGGKETVTISGILGLNYTSRRQYITVRTVSKRRIYSDVSNYIDIPLMLNLTLTTYTTTCKLPDSSLESISTIEIIIAIICCLIIPLGLIAHCLWN